MAISTTGKQGLFLVALSLALLASPHSVFAVDMQDYNDIEPGMRFGKVMSIAGDDCEETGSSSIAGIKTESYLWKNRDGSCLFVIFQDGEMVSKSQHGLHWPRRQKVRPTPEPYPLGTPEPTPEPTREPGAPPIEGCRPEATAFLASGAG